MHLILIPVAAVGLALTLQEPASAAIQADQNPILADDTEDDTEKKDKKQGTGDEEPECE